jgi:hypothetical protein
MTLYHGTIKKFFKIIKKEGIKQHSSFTPFLQTAISMGGPYIFAVDFPRVTDGMLANGGWEFHNNQIILPSKIEYFLKINAKLLKYNKDLIIEKIAKEKGDNYCEFCNSTSEITYLLNGHDILPTGGSFSHNMHKSRSPDKIVLCPYCNPTDKKVIKLRSFFIEKFGGLNLYDAKQRKLYIKMWN